MIEKVVKSWSKVVHKEGLHDQEYVFASELIDQALRSEKILEIGVGNGRMQRVLINNGCSKSALYGIDLTDQVYNSEGKKQVGDARNLPYNDNMFDLVYSLGVVEHFPETENAILEHFRVVKPGGMVVVTTPHLSLETFFRWLSYYKSGRYKDGTFMETKGRNYRIKEICNMVKRSEKSMVVKSGACGPIVRFIRGRFPYIYSKFLKKYEGKYGSYLYIIAIKK